MATILLICQLFFNRLMKKRWKMWLRGCVSLGVTNTMILSHYSLCHCDVGSVLTGLSWHQVRPVVLLQQAASSATCVNSVRGSSKCHWGHKARRWNTMLRHSHLGGGGGGVISCWGRGQHTDSLRQESWQSGRTWFGVTSRLEEGLHKKRKTIEKITQTINTWCDESEMEDEQQLSGLITAVFLRMDGGTAFGCQCVCVFVCVYTLSLSLPHVDCGMTLPDPLHVSWQTMKDIDDVIFRCMLHLLYFCPSKKKHLLEQSKWAGFKHRATSTTDWPQLSGSVVIFGFGAF